MTTYTIHRTPMGPRRWCCTMRVYGQLTNVWYYRTRLGAEISVRILRWRAGGAEPQRRWGCRFCEVPTDTWTEAEYDRHQHDVHGIRLYSRGDAGVQRG